MGFKINEGFRVQGFYLNPDAGGGEGTGPSRVGKLALLGDSLTDATSGDSFGFKVFFADGYGMYLRRRLEQRVELVINPLTGDYEFGINGAEANWYLGTQPTAVAYLNAILASDADNVLVLLGANDMVDAGGNTGAQCAADIIAIWDILIAAGKKVIGVLPLPQRQAAPDAANYLARRLICNPLLVAAAAARWPDVQLIDASSAVDSNGDSYLDTNRSSDNVHLNVTGAAYVGVSLADAIALRVAPEMAIEIPPDGDPRWKTQNPYANGTPGPGNAATNWNVGSVVIQGKQLIARTDGVAGNWQELTISDVGIPPGFGPPPVDGYFANFFTQSAGNFTTGAKLVSVMEVQLASGTPYSFALNTVFNTANKTSEGVGGLSAISAALPLTAGGILMTPPWVSTGAAASLLCRCAFWGNCVIRVGRFGTFEVP